MIMRESLYKDAHPLHKVSKKIFYFIFLMKILWLKMEKEIFLFYFFNENPLTKNGKK